MLETATSGTCVDKCGFVSTPHGPPPSPPLLRHPPPWAPEIGTAASSSFWLPSSRNVRATVGWGLIGTAHAPARTWGLAPAPTPHPPEDFSLNLRLGCHLPRAGCTCPRGRRDFLKKQKVPWPTHPSPAPGRLTCNPPTAGNSRQRVTSAASDRGQVTSQCRLFPYLQKDSTDSF